MRWRRLLRGQQRSECFISDKSSANDESFSDSVATRINTDWENDYWLRKIPVSSSDNSNDSSGSDIEGDIGRTTIRERIALFVTKHPLSVTATTELLQSFIKDDGFLLSFSWIDVFVLSLLHEQNLFMWD